MTNIISNKTGKTKGNKTNTVLLPVNNTIHNAETLKRVFITGLSKTNPMGIIGKNIKEIDITFIQLLYSLQKSAKRMNKLIHFDIDLSDDLKFLIERNGIKNITESFNINNTI